MEKLKFGSVPFIPGVLPSKPEPLSRYLPPIPEGIISNWLKMNVSPGSWLLDPFSASPRIAVEAARAGYRILVTANNPISRFLLEMNANPPAAEQLKSALAELAASYIGDERIELHIRSLYNTYCARCGQVVSADAFIWEHGNTSPTSRIYTCPSCGDSGEHPCTAYDAARSTQFSAGGLHKARALERVVAANDQDRIHVEQALIVYLPRALYALIAIINKVGGLDISAEQQRYLSALLLYAFDQTNSLWRVPAQKERRRQLIVPRRFRETNIWSSLEDGVKLWSTGDGAGPDKVIPVTTWPEIPPPTGGICIFDGRLLTIADSIKSIKIKAVCTAIPRPNQAFWTLSALWAGWLWGREAVGRFKSVLHRQRYDWAWHTTALSSVFKQLVNILDPSTPVLGLIGEAEPGFIGATLVAAAISGARLDSMAIRPEEDQAQVIWKGEISPNLAHSNTALTQVAIQSARQFLQQRGEPVSYITTIAAAFWGITGLWAADSGLPISRESTSPGQPEKVSAASEQAEPTPSVIYSSAYNSAREALSFRTGFLRYNYQDIAAAEIPGKSQVFQTSLFTLDTGQTLSEDDGTGELELTPAESESVAEKERPTRSSDVTESTLLWLRDTADVNRISLTDAYETALTDYLVNHPGCTLKEIDQAMCAAFPGLHTPDTEFIHACLESYGITDPIDVHRWFIRPEDILTERQTDLENAHRFLYQIGERLGFLCSDGLSTTARQYISWLDEQADVDYWFYPMVSANIGEVVLFSRQPPLRGYIVLPGSRANLLIYKLRRDPRLSRAFNPSQGNWRFLKFRHLRSLAESPLITRENMDQLLGLDPLTYSTPQLWLI